MQLPGCKLKLEIKTLDGSAEKSSPFCIIQDSRATMPRRNLSKGWLARIGFIQAGEKETKNEGWVLFFCRCRDKCRNQWFQFSEGKNKMKGKGCKSKKNKGRCWHSVHWFLFFLLKGFMGSFTKSTDMGCCSVGESSYCAEVPSI